MSNLDDLGGELPDTIDGRLAGIERLVDTFGDELDLERRRLRREVIELLVAQVRDELERRTTLLLARVPAS